MALKTDREKTAHLLRRFGLGASEAELDYYAKDGYKSAVEKLLDYDKVEDIDIPVELFAVNDPPRVNMPGVQGWWMLKLLATRRPLQEKMTLFWHDHFATSASKVNVPPFMYQQNEILRKHATGRFQDMLVEVSKDPAMLFWLDNQYNVKGKPNENFAREVMELFTLGIGNYTEDDVLEAARAFTGWTFRRAGGGRVVDGELRAAEFLFRPNQHDSGDKELLGNKGTFGGEEVIGILCGNPQTSRYLTAKIWEWFVYESPEPAVIDRLAKDFHQNGLNVKRLLRNIMESPEFVSEKAERAVYKNPIDFAVPPLRQIGVGEQLRQFVKPDATLDRRVRGVVGACNQATNSMGMSLLFPPDVNGWEHGKAWISSATIVERIQWADQVFGAGRRGRIGLQLPAVQLLPPGTTPEKAVETLLSTFDASIPKERHAPLVDAARKASEGAITARNANATATAVTRLIFGSPEFQFA